MTLAAIAAWYLVLWFLLLRHPQWGTASLGVWLSGGSTILAMAIGVLTLDFPEWLVVLGVAFTLLPLSLPPPADPVLRRYLGITLALSAVPLLTDLLRDQSASFQSVASLLFGGLLTRVAGSPVRSLRVTVVAFGVMAAASVMLSPALPSFTVPEILGDTITQLGWSLRGPFLHPNQFGQLAGITVILGLTVTLPKATRVALVMSASTALLLSNSRTAMLATVLAVGVLSAGRLKGSWLGRLLMIGLTAGALAMLWHQAAGSGNLGTYTGRTELWGAIVDKAMESPLVGWGANGLEDLRAAREVPDWAGSTHSLYLNVLLNSGLIGVVILSVWLLGTLLGCLVRIRMGSPLPAALLTLLLANGLLESNMAFALGPLQASGFALLALALASSIPVVPGQAVGDSAKSPWARAR